MTSCLLSLKERKQLFNKSLMNSVIQVEVIKLDVSAAIAILKMADTIEELHDYCRQLEMWADYQRKDLGLGCPRKLIIDIAELQLIDENTIEGLISSIELLWECRKTGSSGVPFKGVNIFPTYNFLNQMRELCDIIDYLAYLVRLERFRTNTLK